LVVRLVLQQQEVRITTALARIIRPWIIEAAAMMIMGTILRRRRDGTVDNNLFLSVQIICEEGMFLLSLFFFFLLLDSRVVLRIHVPNAPLTTPPSFLRGQGDTAEFSKTPFAHEVIFSFFLRPCYMFLLHDLPFL
jgi:hypothetical protein